MPEPRQEPSAAEGALAGLLDDCHLAAPHELAGLVRRHAATLGAAQVLILLADLQQRVLVPLDTPDFPDFPGGRAEPVSIDGTLPGRAFQHVEVLRRDAGDGVLFWLPMLDGTDRIGVLGLTLGAEAVAEQPGGLLEPRLRRFASLVAELVVTKTLYGDTIVRLRRQGPMGLAAELQWGLLPPLTFACREVTIAAALEPAYEIAGDTVDYAVDRGVARVAVFDGMGHGLRSAQLASVAVAAYRSGRRHGRTLTGTTALIHEALVQAFEGAAFSTAVLAELDTDNGVLTWVNAGHPEPLLLRGGRPVRSLHARPTLPLGLVVAGRPPAAGIAVGREQLEPDDRVLFFTDGVTEARSPTGEFFGDRALADLLGRNLAAGLPAPETMRRVVRTLLEHQRGRLTDDATLLLLEWRSAGTGSLLPRGQGPG